MLWAELEFLSSEWQDSKNKSSEKVKNSSEDQDMGKTYMQMATITTLPGPCRKVVLFPDRGFETQRWRHEDVEQKGMFPHRLFTFWWIYSRWGRSQDIKTADGFFFPPQRQNENSSNTRQQRVEYPVRDRASIIIQQNKGLHHCCCPSEVTTSVMGSNVTYSKHS